MVEHDRDGSKQHNKKRTKLAHFYGSMDSVATPHDCVFNGASPNLAAALIMAGEETRFWNMAGVKGLSLVTGHKPMEGD
ncbi:hypothetical protein PR202_gb29489 [Eleusine coracana subsp. coracana]|uniref:Uncharacterized protein n=1 Tax=Eleusine coracana subsp. coracana TaxID=191504 RepID=A0AAV5G1P5_ELECO|nr:hypothetical protein PR202_gb29489 [Eleusine coracana subsp. coracana]